MWRCICGTALHNSSSISTNAAATATMQSRSAFEKARHYSRRLSAPTAAYKRWCGSSPSSPHRNGYLWYLRNTSHTPPNPCVDHGSGRRKKLKKLFIPSDIPRAPFGLRLVFTPMFLLASWLRPAAACGMTSSYRPAESRRKRV